MSKSEFPLTLVIKATDKATESLRRINGRISKFTAPVRKLNNSFAALSAEAGFPKLIKGFQGVGSAVATVGARFAAMAGVAGFALFRMVKGAVDAGDKLSEMAQRTGLSVDAYAQLSFAAGQADVDQEAFNGAMDQFNKRLGEMKAGTGPMLAFLKKVSPALALQVKGATSTEDALGLMTRAMEKVKDPAKRAALSAAAFGRSGLQMGQFLGQGNKAIDAQRKKFFQLAGSQKEFADNSSDADNAMKELDVSFMGLRNTVAGALFPALTELARALAGIVSGSRGDLRKWAQETGAALSNWVRGGGLTRLVDGFKQFASGIGKVVEFLGGFKGVALAAGLIMAGPLLSSLVNLGAAFATLNPLAQAFLLAAAGIAAAGKAIYDNWEPLKETFSSLDFLKSDKFAAPQFDPSRKYSEYEKANGLNGYSALGAEKALAMKTHQRAAVDVNFVNAPPKTRFTPLKNDGGMLNLSYGYTMQGGQ